MAQRVGRYVNESGHVAVMADRIPFLSDLESGIRTAWNSEKAAGQTRSFLIYLAGALSCYLKAHPSFMTLLDELPGFASEFSKFLIGIGEPTKFTIDRRCLRVCQVCRKEIYLTHARPGVLCPILYFAAGPIVILNGDTEEWFCSKACLDKTHSNVWHRNCGICEEGRAKSQRKVADPKG